MTISTLNKNCYSDILLSNPMTVHKNAMCFYFFVTFVQECLMLIDVFICSSCHYGDTFESSLFSVFFLNVVGFPVTFSYYEK